MTDPAVLRKKAQKKRQETKDDRWKAPIEKSNKSFFKTLGNALLRPFEILIFEPMALILDLYSAILLGILYLFFGAFAVVFEGVYGFNLWQVGLTFLGLLVGMFTAAMSSGLWQRLRARLIARNGGKIEPEFRLPPVIVGAVFVTVGLFWFAWTTLRWVHWIVPIIGSAVFACGVSTFLFPSFLLFIGYVCGGAAALTLLYSREKTSGRAVPGIVHLYPISHLVALSILCHCGTGTVGVV